MAVIKPSGYARVFGRALNNNPMQCPQWGNPPPSGLSCPSSGEDVAKLTLTVDDGSAKTETEVLKQTGIYETTVNVQTTFDKEIFIALDELSSPSFK